MSGDGRRAFTLVELLVVIAILAILAGLSLAGLSSARQQGRIDAAKAMMARLSTALGVYKTDFRSYPPYYPGTQSVSPTQPNEVEFSVPQGDNAVTPFRFKKNDNARERMGNCRVLGPLWGTYDTSATSLYAVGAKKVTYFKNADLAVNPECNDNLLDPFGQPIMYVYLSGRPVISTDPSGAATARPLNRWTAKDLGDASRGQEHITTTGNVLAPYGRPVGAPAPWRNAMGQYPNAMEYELWSAGPDGLFDNSGAAIGANASGLEKLHDISKSANRDNIAGVTWRME